MVHSPQVPRNRTELLALLSVGWNAYNQAVSDLTDDQWVAVPDAGDMTAQDHVANVTAWENALTELFRSGTSPATTFQVPFEAFVANPLRVGDSVIFAQTHGQSTRRARRNRDITHARLIATLDALDDGELQAPLPAEAGFGPGIPVVEFAGTFLSRLYAVRRDEIILVSRNAPDSPLTLT